MPVLTKPTKLEGEYSTWALKWGADTSSDTNRIDQFSWVHIDESNDRAVIVDPQGGDLNIRKLSDGTKVSEMTIDRGSAGTLFKSVWESVLGKYMVEVNQPDILIYKDGVLQQTLEDVVGAGEAISGIHISPNGKYIFVCNFNTSYVLCYEGS